MVRKKKTNKEFNEEKWKRMRLIMEKLEEAPMVFKEIFALFSPKSKIIERTVQNYLAELKALGIIVYDALTGEYDLACKKIVYKTKNDHELALRHSEKLISFTLHIGHEPNEIDPFYWIYRFVYEPKRDIHFMSHLKTGYHRTIWLKLESCRKIIETYERLNEGSTFSRHNEEIPPKVRKEFDRLNEEFVKELSLTVAQVKHGIPLKGSCELCPAKSITVKD